MDNFVLSDAIGKSIEIKIEHRVTLQFQKFTTKANEKTDELEIIAKVFFASFNTHTSCN